MAQTLSSAILIDRAVYHALRMLSEEEQRTDFTATHIFTLHHKHQYVHSLMEKLSLLRGDSNNQ